MTINRLRQALHAENNQVSAINQLAAEWGFWHTGQLAKDYYSLFGEVPSQTVRL